MNKIIVTTTINAPTEAILKYANMSDWHLVVAGDLKTPHDSYQNLDNVSYLSPEKQEEMSKVLSESIGWNSIQRRNFALLQAYNMGADIVATIDDDNIPKSNWGEKVFVGKEVEVDMYNTSLDVFDPIFVTEHKQYWHRGFPLQYVAKRSCTKEGKQKIDCLVQADFWDGDPDVDAICRMVHSPNVEFSKFAPFASQKITPFNSQNTFLDRRVLPYYMMIPHIGRMDDIWGAYLLQKLYPDLNKPFVVFNEATVYQDRNVHDLTKDFNGEVIGYQHTLDFLNDYKKTLPAKSYQAFEIYRSLFT